MNLWYARSSRTGVEKGIKAQQAVLTKPVHGAVQKAGVSLGRYTGWCSRESKLYIVHQTLVIDVGSGM